METLQLGSIKLTWLNGGVTHLDGGAMFGVVPKPLWSKKYPHNENNQIELRTDPILVQTMGINILIESGIGNGKLDAKKKRNYGVTEESNIEDDLKELGLSCNDIDYILMTHLHFDHACGLSKHSDKGWEPVFPNAKIITSKIEWDEMKSPNIRSRNTYWKENWEAVSHLVEAYEDEYQVAPGIKMIHTGGHSEGHSIIVMEEGEERLIHMADLMPTHAHLNPLWVLAFDDYPMTSIYQKEKWIKQGLAERAWYSFYHDAFYRAIKWDREGKEIIESVKRNS
ncbi:YtnP family quorum-quenching lactonase [Peribacillus sp. SCS-155]|uniref:YtnP family quorum-quenching lactonase n=1 Tax=Peribacillus sedimenti TaxID=3115297 RepID=UPI0039058AF4